MHKKKILKKPGFSLEDISETKLKHRKRITRWRAEDTFLDSQKVGTALLECLIDNDPETFIEILDSYLRVNKLQVAKNSTLSRSTVQQALSKIGDAGWDHLASHSKMVPELANQELNAGELVTVMEKARVDYQRAYPRPKEHEISRRDRLHLLRVIIADAPVVMRVIDEAQTYIHGDDKAGGDLIACKK